MSAWLDLKPSRRQESVARKSLPKWGVHILFGLCSRMNKNEKVAEHQHSLLCFLNMNAVCLVASSTTTMTHCIPKHLVTINPYFYHKFCYTNEKKAMNTTKQWWSQCHKGTGQGLNMKVFQSSRIAMHLLFTIRRDWWGRGVATLPECYFTCWKPWPAFLPHPQSQSCSHKL